MSNMTNHDPAPWRNCGFHLPVDPGFCREGKTLVLVREPTGRMLRLLLCWKAKLRLAQGNQNLVLSNYN